MIKCNKGKMEFKGNQITLRAEMTCLVNAFLDDKDLCEGDTRKERLEWFSKRIVERAYDDDKRSKEIQEAAQEIAKLLGKSANDILESIAELLINDDDEEEEEND